MKKLIIIISIVLVSIINHPSIADSVKVGDIIQIGRYEQDNNLSNGPEPLNWKILEINENGALLISELVIDSMRYHDINEEVTWETCAVRRWLNNDFYSEAFTRDEKIRISTVILSTQDHRSGVDGGNDTEDNVFLLSLQDVEHFFPMPSVRLFEATEYAKEKGALSMSDPTAGFLGAPWWTRSPGDAPNKAMMVFLMGHIFPEGDVLYDEGIGILPAIYLKLD